MVFTENYYVAQVVRGVIRRLGRTERATTLSFAESPVERGSRRTGEQTATTRPFENVSNFDSSIDLTVCGRAQVRTGEHQALGGFTDERSHSYT